MTAPVLDVSGLRVDVGGRRVVDGLDLVLRAGEATALVGRSGSGKSLTARALTGLLPEGAARSGAARFTSWDGTAADLLSLPPGRMRALRGPGIGHAFQEAQASLNPTVTVGAHLKEALKAHGAERSRRRARGLAALRGAGLEDPERLWRAYPFELSGGQAQRVALALACVLEPRLLIADEVTSALDPLTQAAVLDVLRARTGAGGSLLLITHDLAVAARWADRVAVLDRGRIAEAGPADEVLRSPRHPFTRELVRAAAPGGRDGTRPAPSGPAAGAPAAVASRAAGGAR
ncbi:ABC transporter ATP-binding protein [Nocardiopsis suaedae]|uniref:ABC transporter ATP-binding protein n=1 Tax=Nocardiopsis suaedae TaxID=3018444 RepID=A0ABT4TLQ3_9ACTN|nr:ABC transporter ATP-binding protein [Nocardiopsis suaedae]MDA2805605.1 ABC transporter ATP-binding protein [Nocardiopsis suaedae]